MTWKKLTEDDCCEWKLMTVDPYDDDDDDDVFICLAVILFTCFFYF